MIEIAPRKSELRQSAVELIERYGQEAVSYMHDRIASLSKDGANRNVDQAYRLLTEVECLLQKET